MLKNRFIDFFSSDIQRAYLAMNFTCYSSSHVDEFYTLFLLTVLEKKKMNNFAVSYSQLSPCFSMLCSTFWFCCTL